MSRCQAFRPFTQYFVEALLAAITASSLLGYDATSVAHLYLGSFSHSSLQILSSSVRLDGERRCTAILKSFQRCSIGFKSGLCLGHSWTFRHLSPIHSCVVLAVCLRSLSCWKVNLRHSLSSWALALEQVFIKDLSDLCSTHFSLLISLPIPAAEKHPKSMMLLPPCFTVGVVPGFL
jgi:hypothetical protein